MSPDLNTRSRKNSRFRHTLRFFREVAENTLDNPCAKCYIKQALNDKAYARVVELADSLDSGSSVHSGRAGSSPASRTNIAKVLCTLAILFFHFTLSQPPAESPPAALFANAKQIGFEAGLAPSSSPAAL
jgi:hypothetical protein